MCFGYGSCKRQAERNASVNGLIWLDEHREELIELRLKPVIHQPKEEVSLSHQLRMV
jgi:hypothetical protein